MRTPLLPAITVFHLRGLFWLALLSVLALALLPSTMVTEFMLFSDKIMHAIAFLVLATLGYWAYPKHIVSVFLGLLFYGALLEFFQALTETRAPEWSDWLADAIGSFVALYCLRLRDVFFNKTI